MAYDYDVLLAVFDVYLVLQEWIIELIIAFQFIE